MWDFTDGHGEAGISAATPSRLDFAVRRQRERRKMALSTFPDPQYGIHVESGVNPEDHKESCQ